MLPKNENERRIAGLVFIIVSIVGLIANISWLSTGDIHKFQFHITMRWGWAGFWISTILAILTGLFGLILIIIKKNRQC